MATSTLRPNGTDYNSGWTLSTGTTPHTLVDDDPVDDATYVQAAATGDGLLVFDFAALSLPAYAQIRSVTVQARRRGNSSAFLDVAIGYLPDTGNYQSIVLSSGEKPTSTILTKTYGSLVQAPGGVPWNNSNIIPRIQVAFRANNTNIRVYEVYLVVTYDEAPECVITSPLGELTGTQIPQITFSYSDFEGSPQERVRAKIFTDAQYLAPGFGPDTSVAFWDSGVVLTSAPSVTIGTPLPPDTYRAYVKVADAGSNGRFGPWATADFSIGGQLPATPTVTAEVDADNRRISLTVTQRDNRLSYTQSAMSADDGEGDGWYADFNTVLDNVSTTSPTATTLTETFTGANGALAAGNTDINWTVVAGAFAVNGNQLTSSNTELILPPAIRHDTALPSTDHYAQISVVTLSTSADRSCGVILRFDASSYTGYVVELNQNNNRFAVWKAINGAGYPISGFRPLPKTLSLTATWRAEISGSTISVYIQMSNDTDFQLLGQWTDTSITSGTRTGITLYNANSLSRVDSFESGDLEPVVGGGSNSGEWLGEMTITAAGVGSMNLGGRNGWGIPVTEIELLTVTAAAWQSANAVRDVSLDVEFHNADGPLVNSIFEDEWAAAATDWSTSSWTSSHVAGGDSEVLATHMGRLTTGAVAFASPGRMLASPGMAATGDSEICVKMVLSNIATDVRGVVGLRANAVWLFSSVYPTTGIFVEVVAPNLITVRDGPTSTVLNGGGAGTAHSFVAEGIWVRLRLRDLPDRSTCLIQAKWWNATVPEPETWTFVAEHAATYGVTGRLALSAGTGTANVRTIDFSPVVVDDLSNHDFGSTWETTNDGELSSNSRNVVVPAGATYLNLIPRAFSTGASEVFVWAAAGVLTGGGREWSRGGLTADNMYGPNESSFENASAGVAGWVGLDDATVARVAYPSSVSGAALTLAWDGSSGLPEAIVGAGPGKPAVEGESYAVRSLLHRVSSVDICRIGIEFRDSSEGVLARSFSDDILPTVGIEWRDTGSHSMIAPEGTSTVHVVFAASPVSGATSAAITAVRIVPGTDAPAVYQPGPLARAYARVEYSDDGGLTWELVRGVTEAFYGSDFSVIVHDHEAPPGARRYYRASTAAVDYYLDANGGATVTSEPSDQTSGLLPAESFWFRDPLVPARLLEIKHSGDLDQTSIEPQEVHVVLSRDNLFVVSDGVKGEHFEFPLTFTTAAGWRQFEELRRTSSTLLFQSDFDGEQWYIRLGDSRRSILKRSQNRATTPVRMVEISANQVDRPDPAESNSGIVTKTVWKTV